MRWPIRFETLLAGAAFALFALSAGPSFYWLDSAEFVAAAWGLGVAHPPGHSLHSLLAKALTLVPLGTIAFRVTLLSAICSAFACWLIGRIVALVLPGLSQTQCGIASLSARGTAMVAAATSLAIWFQAVRSEVYALNLAITCGAIYLALRWEQSQDQRQLLYAALLLGLGLCNHHLLVILACPALLLFVLSKLPRTNWRRCLVGLCLCGLLGLTLLCYLPLRARQSPRVNWGSPSTWQRFGWVVSAKIFQRTVERVAEKAPTEQRGLDAFFGVMQSLSPPFVLLGLAGLYFLWRRSATRHAALLLTLALAGNLLSPILVGFDPYNADAHGYIALSVAIICIGAGIAAGVLTAGASRAHRPVAVAVGALWLGLALVGLWLHSPRVRSARSFAAEEAARQVLDQPAGALVMSSYFETLFNVWALRSVADYRPDLSVLHRNFLQHPGYVEDIGQRQPALQTVARRWRDGRRLLTRDLDRIAASRGVFFEYDLNIGPELTQRLRPAGLLLRYGTGPPPSEHRSRIRRWQIAINASGELESRRNATWTHYLLATYACRRQQRTLASWHLRQAERLAPADQRLKRLQQHCR